MGTFLPIPGSGVVSGAGHLQVRLRHLRESKGAGNKKTPEPDVPRAAPGIPSPDPGSLRPAVDGGLGTSGSESTHQGKGEEKSGAADGQGTGGIAGVAADAPSAGVKEGDAQGSAEAEKDVDRSVAEEEEEEGSEGEWEEEEGEEFVLPATGRMDPAVLATLPPSMQLELLVQVRWCYRQKLPP